ncbi:helix-turn-helix domain-containing protein [Lachnospiraceae bacterium NSJ-143]|nr:helix-turn-helix domain-containing protein [Lachnospiraceae bacterium NSJ-143]
MKGLYTIGETAKLLGVSTQTLRYYDKIGLLSPCHTDNETGYRYYSYTQFHYIDRIKYLQGFGMKLEDIANIIHSGSVDLLLPYLRSKRADLISERNEIEEKITDIEWYMDYFTYLNKGENIENLYKVQKENRYILSVPCFYKEALAKMEIRLANEKSKSMYADLKFRRQYGYKVDFDAMLRQEFYPTEYFIYFRGMPDIDESLYDIIPAGEYLCFQTQALDENWDIKMLTGYFNNKPKPKLVLALEFEDNLVDYSKAWYEIQILL